MTEKLTLITAIELWKRWFDWQGSPWITTGDSKYCFFCKSLYPIHDEPMCVYVSAKELVALDNKGELADELYPNH